MPSSFSFKTVFKLYFCITFLFPICIFKVLFNSLKCQLCSPASYNISCLNLNLDFQVGTVSKDFPPLLCPGLFPLWSCAVSRVFSFLLLDLCMIIIFTWLPIFFSFLMFMVIKLKLLQRKHLPPCNTEVGLLVALLYYILGFISKKLSE